MHGISRNQIHINRGIKVTDSFPANSHFSSCLHHLDRAVGFSGLPRKQCHYNHHCRHNQRCGCRDTDFLILRKIFHVQSHPPCCGCPAKAAVKLMSKAEVLHCTFIPYILPQIGFSCQHSITPAIHLSYHFQNSLAPFPPSMTDTIWRLPVRWESA